MHMEAVLTRRTMGLFWSVLLDVRSTTYSLRKQEAFRSSLQEIYKWKPWDGTWLKGLCLHPIWIELFSDFHKTYQALSSEGSFFHRSWSQTSDERINSKPTAASLFSKFADREESIKDAPRRVSNLTSIRCTGRGNWIWPNIQRVSKTWKWG